MLFLSVETPNKLYKQYFFFVHVFLFFYLLYSSLAGLYIKPINAQNNNYIDKNNLHTQIHIKMHITHTKKTEKKFDLHRRSEFDLGRINKLTRIRVGLYSRLTCE